MRRKIYFTLFIAGITSLLLVSCGKKQQAPVKKAATADSFAVAADSVATDTVATAPVEEEHGPENDRDLFYLKGNVKFVSYYFSNVEDGEYYACNFSRNGAVRSIKYIYEGGNSVDTFENGRVVETLEDGTNTLRWSYDKTSDGYTLVTKTDVATGEIRGVAEKYYYDSRHRLVKTDDGYNIIRISYDELGFRRDSRGNYMDFMNYSCDREGVIKGYKAVKTDSQGNWTKAVKGGDYITRKIKYWN